MSQTGGAERPPRDGRRHICRNEGHATPWMRQTPLAWRIFWRARARPSEKVRQLCRRRAPPRFGGASASRKTARAKESGARASQDLARMTEGRQRPSGGRAPPRRRRPRPNDGPMRAARDYGLLQDL